MIEISYSYLSTHKCCSQMYFINEMTSEHLFSGRGLRLRMDRGVVGQWSSVSSTTHQLEENEDRRNSKIQYKGVWFQLLPITHGALSLELVG
jgi:hypothetical protein